MVYSDNGIIKLKDQVSKDEEQTGLLDLVFENGKLIKDFSLTEIRTTVETNLIAH